MKKVAVAVLLAAIFLSQQRRLLDTWKGRGFVKTKGLTFTLNGEPFFSNGFNAYWLMSVAADPTQRSNISSLFHGASRLGLSLARTWAFSDGNESYSPLQISPGFYDERVFRGLDFVVTEARKHGIRLILSLTDNYESFGGKKQYVNWARASGHEIPNDDAFFTHPLVKLFYKNNAKAMITRKNVYTGVLYRDDPTILAWELMNEPRCPSDPSGKTLQEWIMEMAAYVKSLDGNHLLEVGLEGFYGPASSSERQRFDVVAGGNLGTDFISNNQIEGIDFATVHVYPDLWLPEKDEQAQLEFLGGWLDDHLEDAREVLKKPLLVTEFGKSSRSEGFMESQRDEFFGIVFSRVYWSAGGGAVGALFWQLLEEDMKSYGDGYEILLDKLPWSTYNLITENCLKLHYLSKSYGSLFGSFRAMA